MEPRNIYKAKVDMSGVPKIFGRFEGGGSLYQYPEDDTELLGLCWTPSAKMRCKFSMFCFYCYIKPFVL